MLKQGQLMGIIAVLIIFMMTLFSQSTFAQTKNVLDVPYIHQRYDTANNFNGAYACAPSSAVMILAYYDRIDPDPIYPSAPTKHRSDYGKYISNTYTYDDTTFSKVHKEPGECDVAIGRGAWGYIWQGSRPYDKENPCLACGVITNTLDYLEKHDLDPKFIESPGQGEARSTVMDEIDSGRPLIGRTRLTSSGHYVVITGYSVSDNGKFKYIVNDPFGNETYYGSKKTCWGCYVEEDPVRENPKCPQPVKYSYSDLGLGDPSRGLILIEPVDIAYPKNRLKIPETIRVYLTDEDRIVEVDFKEYCKNVLPNEWKGLWNEESLKAGALAVKMYGWYRREVEKHSNRGFDVKDTGVDQIYEPHSNYSTTDDALEKTWDYVLLRNGEIFESQYVNGTPGSAEVRSEYEGRLSQYGSQYLASEKGMNWREILHYYYDPIEINKISMKKKDEEVSEKETVGKNRPKTGQSICDLCGEGMFNFCDRDECNSLGACWFKGRNVLGLKFFPSCFSCDVGDNKIDVCEDYVSREGCERDPCYIGDCLWADKYITEEPRCVNAGTYRKYRELKKELSLIHLAIHPECGDNNNLAYKIGEELKKELEYYVNEFKMRNDPKCSYKGDPKIPESFPYWASGARNTHITISLDHEEGENVIYYLPEDIFGKESGSTFGKRLAFNVLGSLRNKGYNIRAKAKTCPGNPKLCGNSYNTTAILIQMDLSKLKSKDLSDAIMNSIAS